MPTARIDSPGRESISLLVFCFFSFLLLLTSSGRLSSDDAGNQLRASTLFTQTGHLGTKLVPGVDPGYWVLSSSGDYYEPHDLGNIVLMSPAALLGAHSSHATFADRFASPPIISRLAASLSYAIFSALGCCFMFKLASLYYPPASSFLLSLGFLATTFFWAYTKSAYDVLGASIGMCMTIYFAAKITGGFSRSWRDPVWLALSVIISGSFRYSLLPFIVAAVLVCLFLVRKTLVLRHYVVAALVFLLGLIPTLLYNRIRMGSPFIPATTAKQFAETGSLTGNELSGLYGMLISPNKGIFEFNPILLILLLYPVIWKRIPDSMRLVSLLFGGASVLYLTVISKIPSWYSVSWGPRYLLPVLPILFFAAMPCIVQSWQHRRPLLLSLITLSAMVSVAPVLVNWHLASSEDPKASMPYSFLPYQQIAVWRGVLLGLQGKPLPAPAALLADPVRRGGASFPDIWTFRLMEQSHTGLIAGALIILVLSVGVGVSGLIILKKCGQYSHRERALSPDHPR